MTRKKKPTKDQRIVANTQRYRTRKGPGKVTLTDEQWQSTLDAFEHRCVYCGEDWEQQDHLIPIQKGGGYTKENIVPSCARCNNSKGNDWPWKFTENLGEIILINGVTASPAKMNESQMKKALERMQLEFDGWRFEPLF